MSNFHGILILPTPPRSRIITPQEHPRVNVLFTVKPLYFATVLFSQISQYYYVSAKNITYECVEIKTFLMYFIILDANNHKLKTLRNCQRYLQHWKYLYAKILAYNGMCRDGPSWMISPQMRVSHGRWLDEDGIKQKQKNYDNIHVFTINHTCHLGPIYKVLYYANSQYYVRPRKKQKHVSRPLLPPVLKILQISFCFVSF